MATFITQKFATALGDCDLADRCGDYYTVVKEMRHVDLLEGPADDIETRVALFESSNDKVLVAIADDFKSFLLCAAMVTNWINKKRIDGTQKKVLKLDAFNILHDLPLRDLFMTGKFERSGSVNFPHFAEVYREIAKERLEYHVKMVKMHAEDALVSQP